MKANMGNVDRILRSLIAVVLIVLYLTDVVTGTLGIVLIAAAAVFLATSFIRVCPLYLPFGISTIQKKLNK